VNASAALLRSTFNQTFGKIDEPCHLQPFGNDVADDLTPFVLWIHPKIQDEPADSREREKHKKGMPVQKIPPTTAFPFSDCPAFDGARLVEEFRAQNYDNRAAPIRDRVSKESAEVSSWIAESIADDPGRQKQYTDDA